jgi:actin-related protein
VLSGGSCLVPGFRNRLLQELRHLLQTLPEFTDIRGVEAHLSIHSTCFPPNCMVWAGASILASLNCEVDKFELT